MTQSLSLKSQEQSDEQHHDKIKGLANEAVGNVKQGIGSATGNEKLQAEGKGQELKGEAQKTTGDVKDGIKNAADTVKSKL